MSSDIERWEPPNDATAFESLCLDLWKDIWQDPAAQKNGRRGQKQDGVDVFGKENGRLVGVQCKQKDGRLWSTVSVRELESEVAAARRFTPALSKFILASTASRDTALQKRANQFTEAHRRDGLFSVEVWAWEDIWHELYRRFDVLSRIAGIYWPLRSRLPPPPPSLAVLVREARDYLEYIAPQCQKLPLIGLDPKANETPLTLDAVYTALDTKSMERFEVSDQWEVTESKPLSALKAVGLHSCLVLKGDPGSGKSTFLSYLSLCLAKHHLEPENEWLKRLEGLPVGAPWIPITIVLRDFVRALPQSLPEPSPTCYWDFFLKTLGDARLTACGPALESALNLGHAVVFLDGLDEIPTDEQREFVRQCTVKFAERFRRSRLVLTSRTIPYQTMRIEGIPDFELAPFDNAKIAAFITAWYTAHVPKPFSREAAEERRQSLQQAIGRSELSRLAGNPMLLTEMALLHTHRGRLPDDRAKLYKEIIELLLLRWDEVKEGSRLQNLLRAATRDENDLLRTLGSVAFSVHGRSRNLKPDETGDIQHHELLDALKDLHPKKSLDWANEVIETIKERAGLLIAVEERVFRFPHRSFQECLAALHLIKDRNAWKDLAGLLDETGYWREVILWAAGRIAHVDDSVDEKGMNLLRRLCPTGGPDEPLYWRRAWLSGEALLEMGRSKVEQFTDVEGPELVARICGLLKELIANEALDPFERTQGGMALGRLGDDRPGVSVRKMPDGKVTPDIAWIEIPLGPFIMGSNDGEALDESERPQFECSLIRNAYRVSRFPVTVAQFNLFVQDGGYARKDLWTETGWQWREGEHCTGPEDYPSAFQTLNHPRVGVSWHESLAYSNWLNETFTARDLILPDQTWRVRLPTEVEWERAARHTDGREYPWAEIDFMEQRCNINTTDIGHTSAVGLFPSGAAVSGAQDLAGNVFEWCLTTWRKYDEDYETKADQGREGNLTRVLRGGSWESFAGAARCAYRGDLDPAYRSHDVGFRLVASPFSF